MCGEICLSGTHSRFDGLNSASSLPSADSTCAGWSTRALRMSPMPGVNGMSTTTYDEQRRHGGAGEQHAAARRVTDMVPRGGGEA